MHETEARPGLRPADGPAESAEFARLVAAARAGDAAAWHDLLVRVRPQLLRQLERLAGPAWANRSFDDLFQDSLLRAFQKFDSFRGGEDPARTEEAFRAWLLEVARTVHLNRSRAKRAKRKAPPTPLARLRGGAEDSTAPGAPEPPGRDPTPTKDLAATERRRLVEEAVAGLEPRQQEIIRLRIFEEWPFPRIAEHFGCDESTVRYHFHEILRRLGPRLKTLL